MQERHGEITFAGNPLTLIGTMPEVGAAAPEAILMDTSLSPVALSSFKGKVVLIASVPSLDTPVCDREARLFNAEAAKLGADVRILTLSMDLPFAQKRWCAAAGIEQAITLSDYKDAAFGTNWGLLVKELRLLARAVFVIDREGKIAYRELVAEMTSEPDYDAAISAAKALL